MKDQGHREPRRQRRPRARGRSESEAGREGGPGRESLSPPTPDCSVIREVSLGGAQEEVTRKDVQRRIPRGCYSPGPTPPRLPRCERVVGGRPVPAAALGLPAGS